MVKFEKRRPTEEELKKLGVNNWGIWTKEVSEFDWEYDSPETFYVLEGEAEIVSGDEKIEFQPGDLVTCHEGVKCVWHVKKPIKKHYYFGKI
ncbi:MAG: cupin domain-containing protein [Candidatus Lokiarchaeota archaeon]|nr:cupin domain-containing protein [Candidatus Harpocratesius repetitus]